MARRKVEVGGKEFVALIATCIAMAAMSIDVMLPAFPDMRHSFGLAPDSTEVSRIITTFFFGLALGQLFYGPLSDRYGRKRLLYIGLGVFVAGAAASATMTTLTGLVVCRFVWGFGAAGPRSLALAMVRDTHEGDRMARTMSHVMATFILVPVFAPGLGSALMTVFPWRVVLWLPVMAAVGLAVWATRLPETLPVARRRSVSPGALVDAARAVAGNRQALAFGLAVTCLFGAMTSYIGSSEIIIDEVFGQSHHFAIIFGLLACTLGIGSLASARLVMRLGLARLVRNGALHAVSAAGLLAVVALVTGGKPPLLVFCLCLAVLLPGVTSLVPNCNTAAMAPLPHVAGMAAAILGTVSTGGGALLGSLVDDAFDGTIRPFAFGLLAYVGTAAFVILVLARPPAPVDLADVEDLTETANAVALSMSLGDVASPGEALEPTERLQ